MLTFLMIALGLVTFLMGVAILLQEPKQGGLSGAFGMGGDQMLGTSSSSGISRFTTLLAVVFFGLSIAVGVMSTASSNTSSIRGVEGDVSGTGSSIESLDLGGGLEEVPLPPGPSDGDSVPVDGVPVDGDPGEADENAAVEDTTVGDEGGAAAATEAESGDGVGEGEADGVEGAGEESGDSSEGEAADGENSGN